MQPNINELQDIIEKLRVRLCEKEETDWYSVTHDDGEYNIKITGYVMISEMGWDPVVRVYEAEVWKMECTSATFYDDDEEKESDITELINTLIKKL